MEVNSSTVAWTSEHESFTIVSKWIKELFIAWMVTQSIIGIVGNTLILAFYPTRSRTGSRTGVFIWRMALLDLFASTFAIPYSTVFELRLVLNDVMCKLCQVVQTFVIQASLCSLVGVAVERYYLVCKPTDRLSGRLVRVLTAGTTVISVLVSVPAALAYGVYWIPLAGSHLVDPKRACYPIAGRILEATVTINALFFILTTLTVLGLYTAMYASLLSFVRNRRRLLRPNQTSITITVQEVGDRDTTRNHEKPSEPEPAESGTNSDPGGSKNGVGVHIRGATMLFGVTLIFIVSWIPFWLIVLEAIPTNPFLIYLFYVNHTTSVLVYLLFNRQFRVSVKEGLRKRWLLVTKCHRTG